MRAPIFAVARHFQFVQIIHAFHQRCNRRIKAKPMNVIGDFLGSRINNGIKLLSIRRTGFVAVIKFLY